jgi:hypothetical protein
MAQRSADPLRLRPCPCTEIDLQVKTPGSDAVSRWFRSRRRNMHRSSTGASESYIPRAVDFIKHLPWLTIKIANTKAESYDKSMHSSIHQSTRLTTTS